jgi:hypothetical protein
MAAQKGRAQVAQRVEVGPGGSWRPGVRVIAKQFAVDPGTVQRISRPSPQASPSDNHRVRNEGAKRSVSFFTHPAARYQRRLAP